MKLIKAQITEENKELREAIKRHTVQLKHKNREQEIEAALERVRAMMMAMHRSDELREVVSSVFEQLQIRLSPHRPFNNHGRHEKRYSKGYPGFG